MIQVTIGGADYTSSIAVPKLDVQTTLNERKTCTFPLRHLTFKPEAGQEVIVRESPGGTKLFAGVIKIVSFTKRGPFRCFEVTCQSYEGILDRRHVNAVYEVEGQHAGDLVRDLITTHVAGENITTVNVVDGPVVGKMSFPYLPVSQAVEEICERVGYNQWIDEDKDLHFCARDATAAPFSILAANQYWHELKVEETMETYRNTQIVRAGMATTSLARTYSYKGDGETKTFSLPLKCAREPTITVNTVAKTVGIREIESGKDWYWSKGEKEVSQDAGAAALGAADTLAVTYYGLYPIVIKTQDDAEIAARAAIEGGTGVHEHAVDQPNVDEYEVANEYAEALLRKYGEVTERVTYWTFEPGLRAGQLQTIQLPDYDLNGDYLIESVTLKYAGDMDTWRYEVTALSGEGVGGWINLFRKIAQMGRSYTIRENEVLQLHRFFADDLTLSDDFEISSSAPESRIGYGRVGYCEVQ